MVRTKQKTTQTSSKTSSKSRGNKTSKTLPQKVAVKEQVKLPPEWKLIDKTDAKILKLTHSLIDFIEENKANFSKLLNKEKDPDMEKDLEDYLLWLQKLSNEINIFSRWGKS